jgi:hypothetical protein
MQAGGVVVALSFDVQRNEFGPLAKRLALIIESVIREQIKVTEGDVKDNMSQYNYWKTGNASNNTKGEMVNPREGMVSVNAQSEDGYPYPVAGNFGTVYMAPRPFFSDAEAVAREEFPRRMANAIDGAV